MREGLSILVNLDHRGAVGADPLVGDGAGCLIQIPDALLRDWARKEGVDLPQPGHYAVAMCFLPQDEKARAFAIKRLEHFVKVEKQKLLGWRDVPTDITGLGKAVIERMPVIKMAIVGRGPKLADQDAFERKILAIRKQTQNPLVDLEKKHKLPGLSQLYMPSFSSRTIVYKGLLLAPQVESFYEDLRNPLTQSALCLVHQRFSTNTFPSWRLAHPYRFIAHNGEINTVRGNVNWMYARRRTMESDLIGADLDKMWPIIPHGQSDTACVDNALELLVNGGYSLSHAMMMLIPEAWAGNPLMDAKRKAFYEYHAALMEPWDGPACIAFTDGRQIGATLDRNGLRPARFLVTDDDKVVMASEAGVLPIPDEKIVRKWRLQPGKMLLIDLEEGRIVEDEELKRDARRSRALRGVAEGDAAQAGRAVGDPRRAGARAVQRSDHLARSATGLRLHPGRHKLLPRADEQGARRSGGLDGHRHAHRRALQEAQASLQLFQAELRAGHQSADRSDPRGAGDVAGVDDRPASQPAGSPRRHAQAAGSLAACPDQRRAREDPLDRRPAGRLVPHGHDRHDLARGRGRGGAGGGARPHLLRGHRLRAGRPQHPDPV